uniref:Uncharacterized protein n=1 Tax=Desertifilum tharense IPPAS B-1220 TaxID=1781255 RepID=A0ACD5GT42_9CYAN
MGVGGWGRRGWGDGGKKGVGNWELGVGEERWGIKVNRLLV